MLSITNNKDSNRTENFTYDALNRITAGWTNGSTGALSWGENYAIDPWGNLEMSPMSGKAQGGNWQCAADQYNRANCLGYDAAGNVTANGTAHYTFDAENRLASAGGITYTYDADGNRVENRAAQPELFTGMVLPESLPNPISTATSSTSTSSSTASV